MPQPLRVDIPERETSVEVLRFRDLRKMARTRLSKPIFDYIDAAAGDERTAANNEKDLDMLRIRPRSLQAVTDTRISTTLLGHQFDAPLGFSPTAFHRMVHIEGECASARAASTLNIPMIVSSMSSVTLEEIANHACHSSLWFQTYIFKERAITLDLIKRAESAGYKAIVVTLGCPVPGIRYRNLRNNFVLPEAITAANFERIAVTDHNNPIHSFRGAALDPGVTWKDIEWLRNQTSLPILLKGIMNRKDAEPALAVGSSGVIVSNHGGRQLDGTSSTISVLREISSAIAGRVPVLVDSGFRTGVDVLKALLLGADAVLVGRPLLWALAVRGEAGAINATKNVIEELTNALVLTGYATPAAAKEDKTILVRSDGWLNDISTHFGLPTIPRGINDAL